MKPASRPPALPVLVRCPQCAGKGQYKLNLGYRSELILCPVCAGKGEIENNRLPAIARGREMRQDRERRGVSLREEARRRGIDKRDLAALEWGRA